MKTFRHLKSTILALGIILCTNAFAKSYTIRKGGVTYDFTFAELAVKYLESGDTTYLHKIAACDGAKHILNHSNWSNGNGKAEQDALPLVKELLTPREKLLPNLTRIKQNIRFAKDSIASTNLSQRFALEYLPHGFKFASHLYFTVGYDLGVAFQNSSSVNLAHSHYLKDPNEMRYYSIHELHHAGFIITKGYMPSLNVNTHVQMSELIAYLTHLEGMATYAALDMRTKEHALGNDNDYVSLQDSTLMKSYKEEYFEIYRYFKETPNQPVTEDDWNKISILSDKRRLWYRVGALMALAIDKKIGRDALTMLIAKPSACFIDTYLGLKE
ncbi:DUF5700 domain-containing putative Zn-dependent protease [uncultured Acetobacteroides sp.]|uniref:DUF5700 domain-containing putative Zn-dependent protease n=1 Tax=uncultured Acetobacteroides sp. TaxID=1760811 RepID=UPI0029F4799D|nr:DUF5700 domain-containing putative Zn-dependent protease [uncultured Acetobacteroides sp.]